MSKSVCKFYSANRNCKFGDKCRYLHCDKTLPFDSVDCEKNGEAIISDQAHSFAPPPPYQITQAQENHEDPVNSSDNLTTNKKYFVRSTATHDEDISRSLPQDDNHSKQNDKDTKKICHYFVRHGKCAFGRNCRFLHSTKQHFQEDKLASKCPERDVPPRFRNKLNKEDPHLDVAVKAFQKVTLITSEPELENSSATVFNSGSEPSIPPPSGYEDSQRTITSKEKSTGTSNKICYYYKSGYCRRGRHCKFSHTRPLKKLDIKNGNSAADLSSGHNESVPKSSPSYQGSRAFRPTGFQQIVSLSELQLSGTEKYRQLDINFLQRRFRDWRSSEENTACETEDYIIDFTYTPSDPDWPFDVKDFKLELVLPKSYPKKVMILTVPSDKQDLPESVRRYLEVSFEEWVDDRNANNEKNGTVELMVRPLFKWLDKNFEDLMTGALQQLKRDLTAKAAGMEFIPATQLKAKYKTHCSDDEISNSESEDNGDSEEFEDDNSSDSDQYLDTEDSDDSEENDNRAATNSSLSLDAEKKGTEIKLRNLQLKQNATSLLFDKLRLILQCARCKNHSELTVSKEKAVSLACGKCNTEMLAQFRPSLAHQFSSVVGYLDLDNCVAFDLIFQDCVVIVSCLGCSKMTKINGMVSGQMIDAWCQACNARLKFATESVKFYHIEPSSVDTDNCRIEVVRPKIRKPPKDPAIREGYPLPDFGTCRHYKQSYRWLRFPCCGKAYPCDVCHDKKEDHEMAMANRMICGHCCKEQNFSSKHGCISCNQNMTKVHSSHWEGGAGCRDKITMSRNDQQKYKNMNKTLSNHKKKVQSAGSKKKTTKLRHT